MVTRRIDVFDPAVVTVGQIIAGTTNNIIPETAEIDGHDPHGQRAHARRRSTTASAASPKGSPRRTAPTVEVDIESRLPGHGQRPRRSPTSRSDVAGELVGADKVVRMPNPIMGAEDFSYVLQRVPGAMVFLGGTPADRDPATARAEPLEPRGVRRGRRWSTASPIYCRVALRHLGLN